jgi:HK97 family phage major capsid protein
LKIRSIDDFPALAAGGAVSADDMAEARRCEGLHADRAADIVATAERDGRDLLASELRDVRRHTAASQALSTAIRRAEIEQIRAAQATSVRAVAGYQSTDDATWLPSMRTWQSWQAETRAVGSGSNAFVPDANANIYWDRLRARSVVLAASPIVLDTINTALVVPKVSGSATVGPVSENTEITGSDPTLTGITLAPKKFAALVRASNEALEDSTPQLRAVIADDLIREMSTYLDAQMLIGTGADGQIKGLANTTGATAQAINATPTLDHFADAIAALEASNGDLTRAAFFIAPRTWARLRKQATTTGEYILSAGDPTQATRPSVFGVPVFTSSNIPVNLTVGQSTNNSLGILADMSQVLVGRRLDTEILMDMSRWFEYDQTAVRVVSRVDMQVGNAAAVVVMTGLRAS